MEIKIDITPEEILALGTDVSGERQGGRLQSEDFIRRLITTCQMQAISKSEELDRMFQVFDAWSEPDEIESDKELFPDADDRG